MFLVNLNYFMNFVETGTDRTQSHCPECMKLNLKIIFDSFFFIEIKKYIQMINEHILSHPITHTKMLLLSEFLV